MRRPETPLLLGLQMTLLKHKIVAGPIETESDFYTERLFIKIPLLTGLRRSGLFSRKRAHLFVYAGGARYTQTGNIPQQFHFVLVTCFLEFLVVAFLLEAETYLSFWRDLQSGTSDCFM